MVFNVAIGWDKAEIAAYHVCAHSIIRNASDPVSILPLNKRHLNWFTNNDNKASTEFAFSRFLVPYLYNYEGYTLFMDSDMLVRNDIYKLLDLVDPEMAVSVVKHQYSPTDRDWET